VAYRTRQGSRTTGFLPTGDQLLPSEIKALTTGFNQSDRHNGSRNRDKEEGTKMKKFGFATVIASGLTAAVLGFAGSAQADVGHHDWVHDIQPTVTVPQVDTSVQQSH
jgi:hypothetical protein